MRGALAALALLAGPVAAEECRLALVLALDVSSSVDAAEDRLQREGLARAMLAPPVARAFLAGDPVALHVFEWSGSRAQASLLPGGWAVLRDEGDLRRAAEAVGGSVRSRSDLSTALGAALGHAAEALAAGPECRARTVDVSGDGIGNEGIEPRLAYRRGGFEGVTVNALVIGGERTDSQLVAWFASEVLHGPGAFWLHVRDYGGYQAAMERKLLRELALPAVGKAARPAPGGGQ